MPNVASKFHVWLLFFFLNRLYRRHEYINVWLYIQVPNIIVGNICWYQEISYYLLHRTIYIISLLYFKYTCDADDVKLAAIELSSFQKTLKIEKRKNTIKVSVHGHWHSVSTHTVLTQCQYGPHSKLIFQEHYHSQKHSKIIHFWRIFCEFLKKSKFYESFITRNWFFGW